MAASARHSSAEEGEEASLDDHSQASVCSQSLPPRPREPLTMRTHLFMSEQTSQTWIKNISLKPVLRGAGTAC